jgi:uncharacterized membrane protein YdjX (TVP38/TMEM64 family)
LKASPDLIKKLKAQLDENRDQLFFHLLFLRVAPIFPNWAITVLSPILAVPYIHFAVATFIGIMPNNYVMTTIGTKLQNMTNDSKLLTPETFLSLLGVATVVLLPTIIQKLFKSKQQVTQ